MVTKSLNALKACIYIQLMPVLISKIVRNMLDRGAWWYINYQKWVKVAKNGFFSQVQPANKIKTKINYELTIKIKG
jgi:hypothetical protein